MATSARGDHRESSRKFDFVHTSESTAVNHRYNLALGLRAALATRRPQVGFSACAATRRPQPTSALASAACCDDSATTDERIRVDASAAKRRPLVPTLCAAQETCGECHSVLGQKIPAPPFIDVSKRSCERLSSAAAGCVLGCTSSRALYYHVYLNHTSLVHSSLFRYFSSILLFLLLERQELPGLFTGPLVPLFSNCDIFCHTG